MKNTIKCLIITLSKKNEPLIRSGGKYQLRQRENIQGNKEKQK